MTDIEYHESWNSYKYGAILAEYIDIGSVYVIDSLGTTNFMTIGALRNEVGLMFKATGVGIGTGTVTPITDNDPLQISSTRSAAFLRSGVL